MDAGIAATTLASSPAAAGGGIDMTMTLLKTAGALALIIGALLTAAWCMRRFGGARFSGGTGSLIRVLDTRMIGPRRYVTVVRIGGRALAVGVTEQGMTLLADLSGEDLGDDAGAAAPPGFAAVLGRLAGGGKDAGGDGGRK